MKLELGNFQVKDVMLGKATRLADGTLEVGRDELVRVALQDPLIASADVQVARPGEDCRIINVRDVVEPKLKPAGDAVPYPGIAGRSIAQAGGGRTDRLANVTLMALAHGGEPRGAHGSREWGGETRTDLFIDMAGQGAISPYASLFNICLILEPASTLEMDHWNRVIQKALFRAQDCIAQAMAGQKPQEVEVLDMTPRPGLPGLVYIPMLPSPEHRFGPNSTLGASVYGISRLTQPWLLEPTEMVDGAVAGTYMAHYTWPLTNTIVLHMCRQHGKAFNFLACIPSRTNWESLAEKQLMADRAAQIAAKLGAHGAIVTTNIRGQRFTETILTVQACERAGVKAVLITEEEDDEDGTAPPLLFTKPEVVSVVSTGTGSTLHGFPPVKRVIGAGEIDPRWYGEQPPVFGRYGSSHLNDVYGFSKYAKVSY